MSGKASLWHNIHLRIMILFLFSLLLIRSGFSQEVQTIDLNEIPQKKLRKYIEERHIDKMQDFTAIHPSWKKGVNESNFNISEKKFNFKNKLSKVWESYRHADPAKSWRGRYVRLGLLISKKSNSVIYPANFTISEVDTGQVYFLNLRFMRGLFKLPTAFEIINIDPLQNMIEYSYIENNIEQGKQTIQLLDAGDDHTKVVHTSYFKSEYPLRDKVIYPFFHNKVIRNFHRNMRHLDNQRKRAVISLTDTEDNPDYYFL
jgi:hypothetical protein